jgi:short-subunit dehydrogenase
MEVNFWGSLNCAFYALPHLKESMGQIVAVSSLAGKTGIPFFSVYGASKAALERFLEALRIELEGTGVTVTIAYPGFVDTGMEGRVIVSDEKSAKRKPLPKEEMMTAPECARKILEAAARRDREIVMTLKGKFGQWLKLIAPGLVDKMASKATEGR